MRSTKQSSTLCWDCEYSSAVGMCPYVDDGTPVEGWWANASTIKYKDGRYPVRDLTCYEVIMCPRFRRDSWRSGLYPMKGREKHIKLHPDQNAEVKALAAAIIMRAVNDWRSLCDGELKNTLANDGEMVNRKELIEFFNSSRFANMLTVCSEHSAEQIREVLKVPNA